MQITIDLVLYIVAFVLLVLAGCGVVLHPRLNLVWLAAAALVLSLIV